MPGFGSGTWSADRAAMSPRAAERRSDMDGSRFDGITRALATGRTRRHALQGLAASAIVGLLGLAGIEDAAACRKTGKSCTDDKKNGDCCSGICRKGKCRSNRAAAGCTVRSRDTCKNSLVRCPKKRDGFRVLLDDGKPFCTVSGDRVFRGSDDRCTELSGGIPGKCVKTCPICAKTDHRACFYKERVFLP